MNNEQLKLIQTLIFLMENKSNLILENELLPYLKKAQRMKEISEISSY